MASYPYIVAGSESVSRSGGTVSISIPFTGYNGDSPQYKYLQIRIGSERYTSGTYPSSVSATYSTTVSSYAAGSTTVTAYLYVQPDTGSFSQYDSVSKTVSWSAAQFNITLDKQSGSGGTNSVTATYGSAMPSITPPTRQGYEFLGYYTSGGTKYYNADGSSAKNADFTSAATLYAHWKVLSILHPVSGGTERTITNIKVVENETVRNIISCYSVKDGVVQQGVK